MHENNDRSNNIHRKILDKSGVKISGVEMGKLAFICFYFFLNLRTFYHFTEIPRDKIRKAVCVASSLITGELCCLPGHTWGRCLHWQSTTMLRHWPMFQGHSSTQSLGLCPATGRANTTGSDTTKCSNNSMKNMAQLSRRISGIEQLFMFSIRMISKRYSYQFMIIAK